VASRWPRAFEDCRYRDSSADLLRPLLTLIAETASAFLPDQSGPLPGHIQLSAAKDIGPGKPGFQCGGAYRRGQANFISSPISMPEIRDHVTVSAFLRRFPTVKS